MKQAADRGPAGIATGVGSGGVKKGGPGGGIAAIAGALRARFAATVTFSRYALHRFSRDGCFAAAGALSYTSLVSLVPLGVIALGVLSAFPNFAPLRQELLAFVFRNFVPQIGEQAAWWVEYFAASATQATAIGIVGIGATGILLLVTVEDQLNLLWRVPVPRPWGQRVVAYWTLMTLGPLLVGMSLTLSTYLDTAARRAGFDPEALAQLASFWPHFLARLVPLLLELIACTLLYCLIPNCAVRWRDGALGAAVAAVAIEILKIGFSIYIGTFAAYQTVYGAIAAIPIFLLWMYVSWLAVLLGAVVAANLPTWRVDERLAHLSSGGVRLGFSLALIAVLARAQLGGATCRTASLAAELGAPYLGRRRAFAVPGARRIRRTDPGRGLGSRLEPRNRDAARSLSRARPAARRELAGPAAGAVADAGRSGDGADRQGRGGGDAGDAGGDPRRDPQPGGGPRSDPRGDPRGDPWGDPWRAAREGGCRAQRVGVGDAPVARGRRNGILTK